jgi:RNA-binding protein FUS
MFNINLDKKTYEKKIKIYKDDNGVSKGDCVITYDDPDAAKSSIDWFNDQDVFQSLF